MTSRNLKIVSSSKSKDARIENEDHIRTNPKKKPLTVEMLRSFDGLNELTDLEAQDAVFTIKAFAALVIEHYSNLNRTSEINTNDHSQDKAA